MVQKFINSGRELMGIAKIKQSAPPFGQKFGSMPVRRGDHGSAYPNSVRERTAGDLGFIQIRGYINVCGGKVLEQILNIYEFI